MPQESTILPWDDSIEEEERSGRPEYEHEMPPIPKPSIAYRFSQMTSLGKRKRTAQERTTPEAPSHLSTSLPGYDSVTSEETPIVGENHDASQYQSRRRHSAIVSHVSKKLKERWRWLNRDSVHTSDSIDVLLQRASEERHKACPGVNDERGRYEGRANIPRVTSYLDLRTVGPSNFYDTPDYRRFQSRSASGSQENDPSSAQPDPEDGLTSFTNSNAGIFRTIRRFSQPSQDGPGSQAHFHSVSWSPKKLFNRSSAKRCGKQPVRSFNSPSQTNVPAAPDDMSAIPITRNFNQPHTPVNAEPVYEIDSNLRWSSSEGSSNERETSFEIRPLDGEPLRPYLDHCVTRRPEIDEHVLPSSEHDADVPHFDTTVSSVNGVALGHLNNQRIRIVSRSPSPPTSCQIEAEVDDSTPSCAVDLLSPRDEPCRNSRAIRAAETRAWWEKE